MGQLTQIYEALDKEATSKIILHGEPGVGKTWMAKRISDRVVRKGKIDVAIWIYLNRIYDVHSLRESLAYQLSILSEPEKLKKPADGQAMPEKLEEMIKKKMDGKRVLLVLDDEGSKMEVDEAKLKENNVLLMVKGNNSERIDLNSELAVKEFKLLITTRRSEIGEAIWVMPLTQSDAKALLWQNMAGVDDEVKNLADSFIGRSKKHPSEILIIAKTMSHMGLQKIKGLLEEENEKLEKEPTQALMSECELIPKSILIDCFSSETLENHFLHQRAMVDFNELISYWIIEGHLGNFDAIEDAYLAGHRVLMDLLDCGLLKKLEASYVMSSGQKFDVDIFYRYEFFRGMQLRLATTFDMKIGKIALSNGMMRTITDVKEEISALVIDGGYIGEVIPAGLLEPETELKGGGEVPDDGFQLEILVILGPTHKHFKLPIFKMRKLRLLVLRGCEFLESIKGNFLGRKIPELPRNSDPGTNHSSPVNPVDPLISLDKLTVLEISGPSVLNDIPGNLFEIIPHLKSLNLSFLQVDELPQSLYDLTHLECLILRGCSKLKELKSLKNSKNLQVLDISGATSIKNIHDKTFSHNKKLQTLDLSGTSIERLPVIQGLLELKSLSLRDCTSLIRIRKIDALKSLEILDISGAVKVMEFLDPSIEGLASLMVFNVSQTAILRLPSNVSNPRHLYLRKCHQLGELTPIEGLRRVEVLDLSGSSKLTEIKCEFFENLECLVEFNLSETGVKYLSFPSCPVTLRRLLLSQCQSLEKLENLSSLEQLEVFYLSGCNELKELEDKSFDKMNRLHTLDVSGTKLDKLPSLSVLVKLKKLHVRGCLNLAKLPGVEKLRELEILDHSGTILEPSPTCHPESHCTVIGPSTEGIDPAELLKNLGATITNVTTTDKSDEKLDLQRDQIRQCDWSISSWQGEEEEENAGVVEEANADVLKLGKPVRGVHFLQLLKKIPSLLSKSFFSRFHFLVQPAEERVPAKGKSSYRMELGLRDIYLEQLFRQQKLDWCLEIRGFNNSPSFLEHQLLEQAEFLVLVDNPYLRSLPDLDSINATKACWIERCHEVEHITGFQEVAKNTNKKTGDDDQPAAKSDVGKNDIAKNLDNLEILWISDAAKLKGISFKSLKSLYLEYCPQISTICSSSSFELEGLENLYIKHCRKLEHVFSSNNHGQKLRILQIKFCDELETIFQPPQEDESKGSASLPELLELELWGLPKLPKVACSTPNLNRLRVGECHLLQDVVDGQQVPGNLEILEVISCDGVKTVIRGGVTALQVKRMELLCLPELMSFGAYLPSLTKGNHRIWGCPKLQNPPMA